MELTRIFFIAELLIASIILARNLLHLKFNFCKNSPDLCIYYTLFSCVFVISHILQLYFSQIRFVAILFYILILLKNLSSFLNCMTKDYAIYERYRKKLRAIFSFVLFCLFIFIGVLMRMENKNEYFFVMVFLNILCTTFIYRFFWKCAHHDYTDYKKFFKKVINIYNAFFAYEIVYCLSRLDLVEDFVEHNRLFEYVQVAFLYVLSSYKLIALIMIARLEKLKICRR